MKKIDRNHFLGVLRISLGWIFLWPFIDKLVGLNFATAPGSGWVDGSSPTMGFLKFGTKGPFKELFASMAGNPIIDWLFMIGLLCIGVALILGVAMRLATYSGALLLMLMWLAALWPEHNPFLDDHLIYALLLLMLNSFRAGDHCGLGKWWAEQSVVQKFSLLK